MRTKQPKPTPLEPRAEKRWAAFCATCGWLHVQPRFCLKPEEVTDGFAHSALQHSFEGDIRVIRVEVRPVMEKRRRKRR